MLGCHCCVKLRIRRGKNNVKINYFQACISTFLATHVLVVTGHVYRIVNMVVDDTAMY